MEQLGCQYKGRLNTSLKLQSYSRAYLYILLFQHSYTSLICITVLVSKFFHISADMARIK